MSTNRILKPGKLETTSPHTSVAQSTERDKILSEFVNNMATVYYTQNCANITYGALNSQLSKSQAVFVNILQCIHEICIYSEMQWTDDSTILQYLCFHIKYIFYIKCLTRANSCTTCDFSLKNNPHKNQTPVHTGAHSAADGHTGRTTAHTYPKRRYVPSLYHPN
jgi:hypothetical protein